MLSLIIWCSCSCVQGAWLWMVICREGGTFAFSAIRLKLAFSKISYCTFKLFIFFKYSLLKFQTFEISDCISIFFKLSFEFLKFFFFQGSNFKTLFRTFRCSFELSNFALNDIGPDIVLFKLLKICWCLSHIPGSSSQNGSAVRRDLCVGSYGSTKRQMTSPSDGSLSSGGGMDCGADVPLSQFDREVSTSNYC